MIMSGSVTETDAQAIFCFSPPDKEKIFFPNRFSILKRFTVSRILEIISVLGTPLFSLAKANSLVVSTVKN